jgi:hypothetical protein
LALAQQRRWDLRVIVDPRLRDFRRSVGAPVIDDHEILRWVALAGNAVQCLDDPWRGIAARDDNADPAVQHRYPLSDRMRR